MTIAILLIIAGFVLLYYGGEFLVKGAVGISLKLGITPLVVGLTVVAFGTSAPELAVSLSAAFKGEGGVALGNIVGSNIANIGLILGFAGLIMPIAVQAQLIRIDIPIMIFLSALLTWFIQDGIQRWEAITLFALLLTYVVFTLLKAKKEKLPADDELDEELQAEKKEAMYKLILFIILGIAGVMAGGEFFVRGAEQIALAMGIAPELIALSVLAIGTSLPELATSIAAARKGHSDIAIGNVVGSNIFNVACIVGATGTIRPLDRGDISDTNLWVMMGMSLLLLPLAKFGMKLSRRDSILLLLGYVGYFAWIILSMTKGGVLPQEEAAKTKTPVVARVQNTETQQKKAIQWTQWNEDTLHAAVQANQAVFVEFTADWCSPAQVKHKQILENKQIEAALAQNIVLCLQADFTKPSDITKAELKKYGRTSFPFYLYYAPGVDKPQILDETLSVQTLLDLLK